MIDDINLYAENPQEPTKLLELMNEFSQAAGYKMNTQKSVIFLYTGNEQYKKNQDNEFTITSKRMKYLGLNFN